MAVIRTCLKLLAVGLLISAVAVRADDDNEEEGDADAGASVGTVIGIDLGESANKEPLPLFSLKPPRPLSHTLPLCD